MSAPQQDSLREWIAASAMMVAGDEDRAWVPVAVGIEMGFMLGVRMAASHPGEAMSLCRSCEAGSGASGLGEDTEQRLRRAVDAIAAGTPLL